MSKAVTWSWLKIILIGNKSLCLFLRSQTGNIKSYFKKISLVFFCAEMQKDTFQWSNPSDLSSCCTSVWGSAFAGVFLADKQWKCLRGHHASKCSSACLDLKNNDYIIKEKLWSVIALQSQEIQRNTRNLITTWDATQRLKMS